jgi:hypothetical protein
MPLRKILLGLPSPGEYRAREVEDVGRSLRDGKEKKYWRVGWILPAPCRNSKRNKPLTRSSLHMDRISAPLLASFVSRIKGLKPPVLPCLESTILSRVFEYLSLVDRACLTLSCKAFFRLFGAVLKQVEFAFPRLLQIRIPILCVNSEDVPRNQLLLRLEDYYWAYCGKFLKLHPRHEFKEYALHNPPIQRRCIKGAGIVDICPCTAWTVRERERCVKILKSPKPPSKSRIRQFEFERDGQPRYTHHCSFSSGDDWTVQAAFVLTVDNHNMLGLHARYTIEFSSPKTYLTAEPAFYCPHHTLASMIKMNDPRQRCFQCHTVAIKQDAPSKDRKKVGVTVVRPLGKCDKAADSFWLGNCRLTGVHLRENDVYW